MSAARCGLCRWRYERTPTEEHPVTQAELQRRFYLHWREKHASLTYGALCAGYGGLEMGIQSVLGGELAWYSEYDADASRIMAHHHPAVTNHGDMTKIDWRTVEPVDVLAGGTPCQDLSHAGKRAGMTEGTRSNLWVCMREAVAVLRPRLVVWENVRGAYSASADSQMEPGARPLAATRDGVPLRALGRVLGDLTDLRYDAWWCGLRAADAGACHGRFRVFVFATPTDAKRRGWDWWAPDTFGGTLKRVATAGGGEEARDLTLLPTPRHSDAGPRGGTTGWGLRDWSRGMTLLPTPRTSDTNGPGSHGDGVDDLRTVAAAALLPKGGLGAEARMLPTPMVGSTSPAAHGQISGQWRDAMDTALQNWGGYEAAIRRCETAWGRTAPTPTEPGKNGQPRLSPRFVEWMMGLPEGHVTDPAIGISRNAQLKALGNGVVPQQAAMATRGWLAHLRSEAAA